jgi:hypothetical protein
VSSGGEKMRRWRDPLNLPILSYTTQEPRINVLCSVTPTTHRPERPPFSNLFAQFYRFIAFIRPLFIRLKAVSWPSTNYGFMQAKVAPK